DRGRARALARRAARGRHPEQRDRRPPLLPLDLLPRAGRDPVRARDGGARVHRRRPCRGARDEDHPAAVARAAAGRDRVAPHAAPRPAGRLGARDTLMSREAGGCAYVLGADGLTQWREPHAGAWLGRLAAAPGRRLRLSAIAGATGLTLSRISRIVDAFEKRGLVERRTCPE